METKSSIKGMMIYFLGSLVSASYTIDNSTMTEPYKKLFYNDPIGATLSAYTAIWGNWFYLLLIMGPYFMMYIYHGNKLGIASIWLLCALAAYEYLIAGMAQDAIFYLCVVAWVVSVIMKIASPYKPEGI